MKDPTKKEMKWFVKRLIAIRKNLDLTPRYTSDIFFDSKEILKEKVLFNIKHIEGAESKVMEMLDSIKNDHVFLSRININEKNLTYKSNPKKIIKISGFQTEILTSYLEGNRLSNEKQSEKSLFNDLIEGQIIEIESKAATVNRTKKDGYIKYYKQGKSIPIGRVNGRKFLLLETLCDPQPGIVKTLDGVFSKIGIKRDLNNPKLKDPTTSESEKRNIIDYTIKELQTVEGLTGRISLTYSNDKKRVALNLK